MITALFVLAFVALFWYFFMHDVLNRIQYFEKLRIYWITKDGAAPGTKLISKAFMLQTLEPFWQGKGVQFRFWNYTFQIGAIIAGRVFSLPHASKVGVISVVVVFACAIAYLVLPGMLNAAVVACPAIGGTIQSLDDTRAMKMPGVKKVVRIDNYAYAVIADTWWRAHKASQAVQVVWDDNAYLGISDQTIAAHLQDGLDAPSGVYAFRKEGDAQAVLKSSSKQVQATFFAPFLAHATMEPMNCTAMVTAERAEIWDKAAQHLLAALDQAIRSSSNHEAEAVQPVWVAILRDAPASPCGLRRGSSG